MSAPASPPLVWITQGKTQHAAFVLEESNDGRKRVRWATTKNTEWLDGNVHIEQELTPRRRRQRFDSTNATEYPLRKTKRHRSAATSPQRFPTTNARRISLEEPPREASADPPESKHNHPPSRHCQSDSDDDSSIEVLLTILPPSPKKKTKRNQKLPKEIAVDPESEHMPALPADSGRATEFDREVSSSNASTLNETNSHSNQPDSIGNDRSRGFTTESSETESANATATEQETDNMARDSAQLSAANSDSYSSDIVADVKMKENDRQSKTSLALGDDDQLAPAMGTVAAATSSKTNSASKTSEEAKAYTCVSSAYIQNLAEICYTILEDQRWRVGLKNERLLAWHRGDDLTAVVPLARRFRPSLAYKSKPTPCHAVMDPCNEKKAYKDNEVDLAPSSEEKHSCTRSPMTTESEQQCEDIDTPEDRALYLYSRLFYRKGPWFRIDDIYSRYYAPEPLGQSNRRVKGADQPPETRAPIKKPAPPPKHDKHTFFQKKPATKAMENSISTQTGNNNAAVIDEGVFLKHLGALKILFEDLQRLKCMGLIRTFQDEEECGKSVGNAGVLLTAEERRQVLLKLGLRKNASAASGKRRDSAANGSNSSRSGRSSPLADSCQNEIWRQMRQQQSISAKFTARQETSGTPRVLLPVSRHVSQVMLEKWATTIVQSSSPMEYVAAPVMKEWKASVKDVIAKIVEQLPTTCAPAGMALEASLGNFGMCIRLREAPLLSLQRCVRLYLCASGGPGEMRSDGGTNGWKSIREVDRKRVLLNTKLKNADYARNVEPPGAHSWHNISYPGLAERFGLASFCFRDAYEPRTGLRNLSTSTEERVEASEQIFYSLSTFLAWEMSAEMRSHADYLIEVNDLLLYNERKRARDSPKENGKENARVDTETSRPMDLLGLLTPSGRKTILDAFLAAHNGSNCRSAKKVQDGIEHDLLQLLYSDNDSEEDWGSQGGRLKTEYEDILCTMGVLLKNIIAVRTKEVSAGELRNTVVRPWLRHLSWDACLAYVLWDIIPVFERRGYYRFAIESLELLVHGSSASLEKVIKPDEHFSLKALLELNVQIDTKEQKISVAFAHFLLSRRARGKALDRLMIDLTHLLRQQDKAQGKTDTKKASKKGQTSAAMIQTFISKLSSDILKNTVQNASVSFSSIRTLARRLKQPLSKTLETLPSQEVKELGLRLDCPEEIGKENVDMKKYSDWVPITDHAVANSVAIGERIVGRRCSFVGHEDDPSAASYNSSLNVEQLAMEFYRSGRLPEQAPDSSSDHTKGGWVGWHDEGGMVRALFRVLCFDPIGMDWCCAADPVMGDDVSRNELRTIHLSPYQLAPFDLHVGYEFAEPITVNGSELNYNRGFYLRRKERIDKFLSELEGLSQQEVSDQVWESIAARRKHMVDSLRKDPFLEKDVLQARTLSMLAAGFGGKMLAAMFRVFFFDYRHYSGGLPDLLLVRARYNSTTTLVDLGDFIGEAFDTEYLAQLESQQRAVVLGDRDDDFLGCSKVGDSGGGGSGRGGSKSRTGPQMRAAPPGKQTIAGSSIPELPQKLVLTHDDRKVDIECMFVEVKSMNDRLDARQEDWLNILDRYGNARVCKFGDGKPPKVKSKKVASVQQATK